MEETCQKGFGGKSARMWAFLLIAVVSVAAKMLLATQGNNYDMESFGIVADLTLDGKTVYAETERYNYGPPWAYTLALLRLVEIRAFGSDGLAVLHVLVAGFLAYVDVAIGALLAMNFSFAAGIVFLLNPVSLLITGYHSQFDNFAILLGLAGSIVLFDKRFGEKSAALAALLLGLSLAVKHILIFFPAWLVLRAEMGWKRKLVVCAAPYAIFAAGFAPFVFDDAALRGIAGNVFGYSTFHLTGFYNRLVGAIIPVASIERIFAAVPVFHGFKFVWAATMMAAGFLLRKAPARESILYCLAAMCAFSSQMADQYLAIPLVACAVFWRSWLSWAYMAAATLYLLSSPDNVSFVAWTAPLKLLATNMGLACWKPVVFLFVFVVWAIVRTLWSEIRAKVSQER